MIYYVKLVVLLFFIIAVFTQAFNYCEKCLNHTMCLYQVPGPSETCKGYDVTSLNQNDINDIVSRINERRNFVAMGLSRNLPEAANMRKIRWSEELAVIAQRWADQCDPSLRPDKEDQCRDIRGTTVGQNIATILGLSPGLNLNSFVEMWFMQTLKYVGNVSYYNRSRDHETNYLTQLIWAETEIVGCGRAKFYIEHRKIERLICNFAPRGNVHGKPVYAIGFSAIQCPEHMEPDKTYPALCSYKNRDKNITSTSKIPPVTSLLRILNLSNTSAKQDIDPIRNNLKQIKHFTNNTLNQRNQKTRHVYLNNSYAVMKNIPPIPIGNYWNNPLNYTKIHHHPQEKDHSRVHHGHAHRNNYFTNKDNKAENYRRFDYVTESTNQYFTENYRKHIQGQQCTRKLEEATQKDCTPSECPANKCTRKNDCCIQTSPQCPSVTCLPCENPTTCSCNMFKTSCPSVPTQYAYQRDCQYVTNCQYTQCPNFRRNQEEVIKDESNNPVNFHYYDFLPNVAMRSGDLNNDKKIPKDSLYEDRWLQNTPYVKSFKSNSFLFKKRDSLQNSRQVKKVTDSLRKTTENNRDYSYDSFYSSERKRRKPEELTFKPFWQMDEFSYKKPNHLKSMKYTTLSNKRNKKLRTTIASEKISSITESITITLSSKLTSAGKDAITEKYLSFDELLHLRKFSDSALEKSARRKADEKDDKTKSTTQEYTINTPFMRKKHCTRKLTCTWSAPTVTNVDGEIIGGPGIGGVDRGSRTPPGYVDGCTRTSTCTRDYMNRNKMPSVSEETTIHSTTEDEDYCERRSLNVQRRNSDYNNTGVQNISYEGVNKELFYGSNDTLNYKDGNLNTKEDCECDEKKLRFKRHESITYKSFHTNDNSEDESFSYGDLFYLVLRRIMKKWENNTHSCNSRKCACNISSRFQNSVKLLTLCYALQ